MSGKRPKLNVELLTRKHPIEGFDCGNDSLTGYLKTHASQDIKRRIATCYVATNATDGTVVGYYTLSSHRVERTNLPDELTRKLPKHQDLPATLLGRLAIDAAYQRQGIGHALVMEAAARILTSGVASWALLVDPIDAVAARFYAALGFRQLSSETERMYVPMATFAKALTSV